MAERHFALVLPLKRKSRLDPGELITELRLFVEQTGATVKMDPRMITQNPAPRRGLGWLREPPAEKALFELDGVRMRVTPVHAPYYERSRIHRFVNPVMWQTGLGEFADHRAHILIHEAGIEGEEGPDSVYDRAAAVTATASVVARLTEPVGAIWTSARNAVPMETFHAAMDLLKKGQAPLKLWLRWHVVAPGEMEDANPGMVTAGLAPFVGREILAPPSQTENRVMIDHAFELARRLVDERLEIARNTTLGLEDGETLRVRLRGPGAASDAPVFQITLPQAQPAPQLVASRPGAGEDAPVPAQPTPVPLPALPGSEAAQGVPHAAPLTLTNPIGIGPKGDGPAPLASASTAEGASNGSATGDSAIGRISLATAGLAPPVHGRTPSVPGQTAPKSVAMVASLAPLALDHVGPVPVPSGAPGSGAPAPAPAPASDTASAPADAEAGTEIGPETGAYLAAVNHDAPEAGLQRGQGGRARIRVIPGGQSSG